MAFMKDFVLTKKNHFLKVRNLKQFQKKGTKKRQRKYYLQLNFVYRSGSTQISWQRHSPH